MVEEKNTERKRKNYYQENEEYHNRLKMQSRERYHKDSDYKKATLERAKKRYYEDEEYKAETIRRAKERYRRLKTKNSIEDQLVKYFNSNGYFRIPDENLRKIKGQDYKKGYEVRLVANDEKELSNINFLLIKAGFKVGKSFQKNNKFVQPIYGKDAVEKFQSLLSKQEIKSKNIKVI